MLFRRSTPRVHRSQQAVAEGVLGIGTQRQQVLAFTVRCVLLRAGLTEAVYDFSSDDVDDDFGGFGGKTVTEGFVVEAPPWAHGESSVGVAHSGKSYTQRTAQQIADILIRAFQVSIGKERAARIVKVVKRQLPRSTSGYTNVTILVPDDKTLRVLYRALGRR